MGWDVVRRRVWFCGKGGLSVGVLALLRLILELLRWLIY